MRPILVLLAGCLAASLAACSEGDGAPPPQGREVGAAMPDTSADRAADATMTAPDAGATGTVPADGSPPALAPTPPVGTAGGAPAPETPSAK
jgi:hypothetical protein